LPVDHGGAMMRAVGDVVVVGSINVDLTVRAPRLPGRGETVTGGTAHRGGGGKGANQAVAAARAGAAVALVAAVGDDDLGAAAVAELRAEGVDVDGVATVAGAATGIALIVVDAAGENQIAVASGANHRLEAAAVEAALRGGRAGACVLISFEIPDAAVLAGARHAAARDDAGAPLLVNPAPARPLPDGLAACAPILTPNQHEAHALCGEADPHGAALALAALTGAPAIVTLGADGALVADPGGAVSHHPAPRVAAVDATGAGDVFNGVLAAALADGSPLRDAVDRAVQAAAESVTRAGARG